MSVSVTGVIFASSLIGKHPKCHCSDALGGGGGELNVSYTIIIPNVNQQGLKATREINTNDERLIFDIIYRKTTFFSKEMKFVILGALEVSPSVWKERVNSQMI